MMKKILATIIIAQALLAILIPGLVFGASNLELWCIDQEQTWEPALKQCTIAPGAEASVPTSLTVRDDERVVISGTLTVHGALTARDNCVIDNSGLLDNKGTVFYGRQYGNDRGKLNNDGLIINSGTFENNELSVINNRGVVSNTGAFANHDSSDLYNDGYLDNAGIIDNYSYLDSRGSGVITNTGVITNHAYMRARDQSAIYNEGAFTNEDSMTTSEASVFVNTGSVGNGSEFLIGDPTSVFLNYGQVSNYGRLYNSGIFTNTVSGRVDTYTNMVSREVLVNYGVMTIHHGRILNFQYTHTDSSGEFYNYGTIYNYDALSNEYYLENNGEIFSWGSIANMDYFNPAAFIGNHGTITSFCGSAFEGRPIHNLDGVIIDYRKLNGQCNYMPLLTYYP